METILEIKDLKKEYKEFKLGKINLSLPRGSIMGIIGPNGAGKTTTIKILMNLIKADGGEVKIFGLTHDKSEREIKNRIGYVGEEQYFYENKTVAWTGDFVSHFYSFWDKNVYNKLLNEFQISASKRVRELSKGMRVKFSLAIALSHNPDLVMLDEPTSGLDPVVRRDLLEILKRFTEDNNRSVLISSHITDDIARIADYITYLVDGKVVLTAEKDVLLADWKRLHFKPGVLSGDIINSLKNVQNQVFGSSGITSNYLGIKERLVEGIARDEIKVENVNLDDILISFVKRG